MLISESIRDLITKSQKNPNTNNSRMNALRAFETFMQGRLRRDPLVSDLYDTVLVDFEMWLLERDIQPRSIQTYLAGVKKWLTLALIAEILPDKFSFPRAVALYKETKGQVVYYHHPPEYFDNVVKLVAHMNTHPKLDADLQKGKYSYLAEMRNRAFAWFIFNTGSRQGAARTMKLNQVLEANGELRKKIRVIGKRGKEYLLFLDHPDARLALKQYLDARKELRPDTSPFVFISHDHNYGEPISGAWATVIIRNAGAEIGLDYTPHDFRHHWAIYKLNNGVAMDVVSKGLGHADSNITATVYAHYKERQLVEQITSVPMPGVG